jgi:hypothetical protein
MNRSKHAASGLFVVTRSTKRFGRVLAAMTITKKAATQVRHGLSLFSTCGIDDRSTISIPLHGSIVAIPVTSIYPVATIMTIAIIATAIPVPVVVGVVTPAIIDLRSTDPITDIAPVAAITAITAFFHAAR